MAFLGFAKKLLEQWTLERVLVNLPQQVDAQGIVGDLGSIGLRTSVEPHLTSALGGLSARKRQLVIGSRGPLYLPLDGYRVNPPLLWKCSLLILQGRN